ncbi:unnamed protein product [Cyclocybe aegerita]|uniref:CHAT domain-containing protein n=1 Tax=Cyclocybe aegerita TaxID=1973307 RepID=A0A8S0XPH8_CYCAE|nr:unnamed protein product [Cyclocybe aegerita]
MDEDILLRSPSPLATTDSTAAIENEELFLTDITLEYKADTTAHTAPEELTLVIFGPYDEMGAMLPLERISETSWRHEGIVEMPGIGEELIMIAFWDLEPGVRKVVYHSVEGGAFVTVAGGLVIGSWEFVADIDSPTFTVTFDVCTILAVERRGDQDEDSADVEIPDETARTTPSEPGAAQAEIEVPDDNFTGMLPLLTDVGMLFSSRFEHTGDLADISKAISIEKRLVARTPDGDPNLPDRLTNLCISLSTRFDSTRDLSDISESISSGERALNITPERDEDMRSRLITLSAAYMSRFSLAQDLHDVSKAISAREKVVQLTTEGDEDLAVALNELGESLMRRFEHEGNLTDITEAIRVRERAVDLTQEGDENLPGRLNNLGLSYFCRFEHSGDVKDISNAISLQQNAVDLTSENHENMPALLNGLGSSLMSRFEYTGDRLNIEGAASALRKAARLAPEGHEIAAAVLNNLGMALWGCFQRSGDINEISEAILAHRKASSLISALERPNCLNNLGISFRHRFEEYGDLLDICEAISALQRSVSLTPEDHVKMPTRLNNLATAFLARFEHTGDLADVSEAISTQQRAVRLIQKDHATMPTLLNTLGCSLSARFQYTKALEDISNAISAHERALKYTSKEHTNVPLWLSNLAISFKLRFEMTADLSDICKAILAQRQAIDLTPECHPYLPTWLNSLGICLTLHFESTGNTNSIAEAISKHKRAIRLTPEGHGLMPSFLKSFGDSYLSRFEHTEDRSDLEAAVSNYRQSANSRSGPPSIRLDSAKKWAELAMKGSPSESEVMAAYETAIRLASQVAGLEQTIEVRHSNLIVNISDLATTAAAIALSFGRHGTAVEWLEHGRCLVWSQINNLRTPLEVLRDKDKELADRFLAVSRALEKSGSRPESRTYHSEDKLQERMALQDEVHKHHKFAREWEELLADIRRIKGFQGFLQPTSMSSLLSLVPKAGPVVVINVHSTRCDALALLSGAETPIHIPLDNFSYARGNNLRGRLQQVHGARSRGEEEEEIRAGRRVIARNNNLCEILLELWSHVVKPILNRLATPLHTTSPSRIWWCPTGPLAFLPIHAAGIYRGDREQAECLSDFAVSSYTPTVSTLIERTIERPSTEGPRHDSFLLVGQPNAPDLPAIPGAAAEVNAIWAELSTHRVDALRVQDEAATIEKDTGHPLKSGFAMHNGWLELSDIIRIHNAHADLSFLSACQTSTGDEELSEEAVHLAGGMLAAGYQGVVATMWAINDGYAIDIAKYFYRNLLSNDREDGVPTCAR